MSPTSSNEGGRRGASRGPGSGHPSEGPAGVGVDEALQLSVGEFGPGQQIFFVLAQLAWIPASLQTMVMVFTGLDPVATDGFRCLAGHPDESLCRAILNGTSAQPSEDFCRLEQDSYHWTHRHNSIVSEWDLVCDELWKQQAVNSAFFAGFLVGAGVLGSLADRSGRKRALLVSLIIGGLSGVLCGAAQSYWQFLCFRAMAGVGVAGIGLVAYVLGCEYVGPSWRGPLAVMAHMSFATGEAVTPLLAYYISQWRLLSYITGGLSLLYMLVVLPVLPESAHWYLATSQPKKAKDELNRMAARNRTLDGPAYCLCQTSLESDKPRSGMLDVLRHRTLLVRLLAQVFAWFSGCAAYYGIALLSADLPGGIYTVNAVLAVVEAASYLASAVLVNTQAGRRGTIAGSYLLGGCCMVAGALLAGPVSLYLAVAAKFFVSAGFGTIFLYATELFPTTVRTACIGAASQAARVGGIVAPIMISLAQAAGVPLAAFLAMGIFTAASGLVLLTQPETLGTLLPDTLEDVKSGPTLHQRPPDSLPDLTESLLAEETA